MRLKTYFEVESSSRAIISNNDAYEISWSYPTLDGTHL